jgi:endonuclease III
MPRSMGPRQPAKTGRHEKARVSRSSMKAAGRRPDRPTPRPGAARAKASSSKSGVIGKGYDPLAPARIAEILKRLDQLYPNVACALNHKSAWELLVATILSAQSTDVNVNRVTPELFRKYPTVADFAALTPEQLEPDVHSTGFFRNKSKSVVGAAKKIVAEFGGQVPDDMEKLLTLPGVARKTANVVLGTAYGIAEGVVVDTHVQRLSMRLGLTRQAEPKGIEQDLMKVIPQPRWIRFSHQLIWHGRRICFARKPDCGACPLAPHCPSAGREA